MGHSFPPHHTKTLLTIESHVIFDEANDPTTAPAERSRSEPVLLRSYVVVSSVAEHMRILYCASKMKSHFLDVITSLRKSALKVRGIAVGIGMIGFHLVYADGRLAK